MRKLVTLAVLAVALYLAYKTVGQGALHLGAPNWYGHYPCPPGTFLNTFWVRSSDPQAPYYWHGYQELGGCAASLQLGVGTG